MAFGFAERRDIERVVRAVLVTERINNSERPRAGVGQSVAPPCAYIAQAPSSGIQGTTGDAVSSTVKFFSLSTAGELTEISTGETVYNFGKQYVYGNSYFTPIREYGSQNYIVPVGAGDCVLAKTDASHSKGASGTVSIYSSTSSDTGHNVTARNIYADLDSGKWCHARLVNGTWYLVAGECS